MKVRRKIFSIAIVIHLEEYGTIYSNKDWWWTFHMQALRFSRAMLSVTAYDSAQSEVGL